MNNEHLDLNSLEEQLEQFEDYHHAYLETRRLDTLKVEKAKAKRSDSLQVASSPKNPFKIERSGAFLLIIFTYRK